MTSNITNIRPTVRPPGIAIAPAVPADRRADTRQAEWGWRLREGVRRDRREAHAGMGGRGTAVFVSDSPPSRFGGIAISAKNGRTDWAKMLDFTLDAAGSEPIFLQIAAQVRSAIAAGHIAPGMRLPSTRALAAQLAVARGTVDAAYALLAGEGAVLTRGSVGTIVSGTKGPRIEAVSHTPFMFDAVPPSERAPPLPFSIGLPALDAFPRRLWSSLTAQAARAMPATD